MLINHYGLNVMDPQARSFLTKNMTAFLTHLIKDQKLNLNMQDEIVRETLVTRGGEIVNARVREFFTLPALVAQG